MSKKNPLAKTVKKARLLKERRGDRAGGAQTAKEARYTNKKPTPKKDS